MDSGCISQLVKFIISRAGSLLCPPPTRIVAFIKHFVYYWWNYRYVFACSEKCPLVFLVFGWNLSAIKLLHISQCTASYRMWHKLKVWTKHLRFIARCYCGKDLSGIKMGKQPKCNVISTASFYRKISLLEPSVQNVKSSR